MRILLVEDEKALSSAICQVLRREQFTVDPVYTGTDGYDYAQSDIYDAIVLDIFWFCRSKTWILPGTADMTEAYHDYGYHVKASCVGMLIGLPVCLLIGLVVQVISWAAA